ncbi:MAG: thioredoxin family protein [Acidobacteria bacterium]|nr:thioredoxin family protein [Acidobacteriota bacterium]
MKKIALVLCVIALATAVGHAQLRRPKADVVPLVERAAVAAGGPVRLALKVSLPDGLHTQSNRPRDPLLIPTVLTIDAPAGVTVDEVVYPPAIDLKQEGQEQPLAVFERAFTVGAQVTLGPAAPAGDLAVPAHLRYQACDANMCFAPATVDFQWTIRIVAPPDAADGPRNPAFDAIGFGRGEKPVGVATGGAPAGAAQGSPLKDADALAELDGFDVLATSGGYLNAAEFQAFIHHAESGVKEPGLFEGRGPIAILILVLIGGLALNLTPCVLPMIPINLAIIGAGAQAGSRGRGFLLGSAYGGAMALVYGVIGLVVILTAGTFGTINSSPWFNAGIAVLFVVLGLAMFDVLMIDFSRYSSGFHPGAGRGTVALAFTMGAVAALLAGACVAPVVIQVVLFSSNLYATGTRIALGLPFVLGLGMALPWPIVGAGLASLPRPGVWMVRVKQAFGVFIFATALYYGYQAYELFSARWVDPAAVKASVEEQVKAGWHTSLAEGLGVAAREHKPVLIDMWATWCKNCLTMDKTTLADPAVQSALAGYVKIKFQAESPDEEPAKRVMQRFGAVGLPTYVILRPK